MTDVVLDTSVAVPLLVTSHVAHRAVSGALAGHALHETYAVLTRLPGDARVARRTLRGCWGSDSRRRRSSAPGDGVLACAWLSLG